MELDSVRSLKQQILSPEGQKKLKKAQHAGGASVEPSTPQKAAATVAGWASFAQVLRPALGVTHHNGQFRLAVRFYDDHPKTQHVIDHLTQEARGEVHVKMVGKVEAHAMEPLKPWYQSLNRPLRIGCSAAEFDVKGGTLGCFVTSLEDGKTYMLSNNHVFANQDKARPGAAILQPGILEGEDVAVSVGHLEKCIPLKLSGNLVDCALAAIDQGIDFDPNQLEGFGQLQGVRQTPLDPQEVLFKLGRTSGCTAAYVSALEVDGVPVKFAVATNSDTFEDDPPTRTFDDQIEVEVAETRRSKICDDTRPFSQGGDSGSLVFDGKLRAVGLLFAGNASIAYVNPIQTVLQQLEVKLADPASPSPHTP